MIFRLVRPVVLCYESLPAAKNLSATHLFDCVWHHGLISHDLNLNIIVLKPAAVTLKLGVSPNNKVIFISTDTQLWNSLPIIYLDLSITTLLSINFSSTYGNWKHSINNFNPANSCSLIYVLAVDSIASYFINPYKFQ